MKIIWIDSVEYKKRVVSQRWYETCVYDMILAVLNNKLMSGLFWQDTRWASQCVI